ncbi:style cell-cycle inhibitor 1-A-like isoform X2 [Phragmites australis]|uniref:style cell-cycle inhibitor 1-A-like isoform X2 n=1 Tax=Phragmites australis TaxID=29695 RepID=UPI002D767311|nr:style cell-cycle inhibitor 1-A-like isoform X2 [Phragmites australis]
MGGEGKSRKRRSSPSSGEEEGRERKRRDKKESRRSSRPDREEEVEDRHKKRKKSKHSDRDKGRERDSKERHSKEKEKSKQKDKGFKEISKDDYFAKNNEFATWLKEEKSKYFSDLSSESARDLFLKFVKAWNKGKLPSQYYEGITSGPRSAHNWNIKA